MRRLLVAVGERGLDPLACLFAEFCFRSTLVRAKPTGILPGGTAQQPQFADGSAVLGAPLPASILPCRQPVHTSHSFTASHKTFTGSRVGMNSWAT